MNKLFKNSRKAKKFMQHVLLNIQAVDTHIKPCYLWDAFIADVEEIQNFLNTLRLNESIEKDLRVFMVDGDTPFITDAVFLREYLNILMSDIYVVDVSSGLENSYLLDGEQRTKVLSQVIEYIHSVLEILMKSRDIHDRNVEIDCTTCNVTTFYGAMVGYPVLYWYEDDNATMNNSSAPMVPLEMYSVTNSKEMFIKEFLDFKKNSNKLLNSEIYSFSVPKNIIQDTENYIDTWFSRLKSKSKNSVFTDLKMGHVSGLVPCVTM